MYFMMLIIIIKVFQYKLKLALMLGLLPLPINTKGYANVYCQPIKTYGTALSNHQDHICSVF